MATTERYIPAIGRRKTATARIRITKGEKGFIVNNKDVKDYFKTTELIRVASESLNTAQDIADYGITVVVRGGGIAGQAVAVRHGIARALTEAHEHVKTDLKKAGFLKRDPRSKERRKFGFRKARKRPQWSKR
jgi:small subunit ribosomal protein S9